MQKFFALEFAVEFRLLFLDVHGLESQTAGVPVPSDNFHIKLRVALAMMSEDG